MKACLSRKQRGAAAVFVAISIVALLAAIFLAIDLGRLYFAQRSLQSMANMAALDAVRVSGGCLGPVSDPQATASGEALASVQRNGGTATNLSGVVIGQTLSSGGLRSFNPAPSNQSYAVRVLLARPAPSRLFPFASANTGTTVTLHASAAAESQPTAQLTVSPELAGASPPQVALLCALLDIADCSATLTVASAQNLFGADVELGQLMTGEVTPQSIREFLNNATPVPGLLDQLAQALENNGNAAAAQTVAAIAAASDTAATIVPSQIFDVHEGFEKPASAAVFDAAAVVTAVAEAAKGTTPITVGPITVVLPPPLGPTATVTVTLLQGLSFSVGPGGVGPNGEPRTSARAAQGTVQIAVPLNLCSTLGLTGCVSSDLTLFMQVGEAHADIASIHCPQFSNPAQTVFVNAGTDDAGIGIGTPGPPPAPATLLSFTVSALGQVSITAQGQAAVPGSPTRQLEFDGPFDEPSPCDTTIKGQCQTISGSQPGAALANALNDLASNPDLLGCVTPAGAVCNDNPLVQPVLQEAAAVLGPALTGLDGLLFQPLLTALGASVGDADITVSSVTTKPPELIGR